MCSNILRHVPDKVRAKFDMPFAVQLEQAKLSQLSNRALVSLDTNTKSILYSSALPGTKPKLGDSPSILKGFIADDGAVTIEFTTVRVGESDGPDYSHDLYVYTIEDAQTQNPALSLRTARTWSRDSEADINRSDLWDNEVTKAITDKKELLRIFKYLNRILEKTATKSTPQTS